jgi:hypothetical protein
MVRPDAVGEKDQAMRDQDLQMKYKQLRVLGVRVRQFDTIDEVLAHLTHEQNMPKRAIKKRQPPPQLRLTNLKPKATRAERNSALVQVTVKQWLRCAGDQDKIEHLVCEYILKARGVK